MAITKILNIKESKGRNLASHLDNALKYIQNPDKTGNRQGYNVLISFSPEEKVSAEQAMYVLEHFAKEVLGDDYEAVFAVHTDRAHMHGHLIWNSVSMTTGESIILQKKTGRIIWSPLRINIVMSWGFP